MGMDIDGWVEVQNPPLLIYGERRGNDLVAPRGAHWVAAIRVGSLLIRCSPAYDSMFGVVGLGAFPPLAPERGVPPDCSYELRPYLDLAPPWISTFYSPSWITWAELKAADWEEETALDRKTLHRYSRDPIGRWVPDRTLHDDDDDDHFETQFAPYVGMTPEAAIRRDWPLGQAWEVGGKLYRMEKERRKDTLNWDWRVLFDLMEVLARFHGDEGVRLVAWFDI